MVSAQYGTPEWILDSFSNGSGAERLAAQHFVEVAPPEYDFAALRTALIEALADRFGPSADTTEERHHSGVRTWILGTLGRLPSDGREPAETLRRYTHWDHEPNFWARYWALEALHVLGDDELEAICRGHVIRDGDVLPRMLGTATLASLNDAEALSGLLAPLQVERAKIEGSDEAWGALRALRVVFIPQALELITPLVYEEEFGDITYDAIVALGNIPPKARRYYRDKAAGALLDFVRRMRRFQFWDANRTRALDSLGRIGYEEAAPLLLEEITDNNPAVARQATLSLEKVLGARTAVARILEALEREGDGKLRSYADALRHAQDEKIVAEELNAAMLSGGTNTQDHARALLSEMGGTFAFEKLRARTQQTEKYVESLSEQDRRLSDLFTDSLRDARRGFMVVATMDCLLFVLGFGLLVFAVVWAVVGDESRFDQWASGGAGLGGLLGIVYGRFFSKPRQQVEASIQHLNRLKTVFLAYLRGLRQIDQAYTRALLEDEALTAKETSEFVGLVESTMDKALSALRKPEQSQGASSEETVVDETENPTEGDVATEAETEKKEPGQ